jgi:tRNA(Arg) A34 adenosine deaminase TadA
MKRAFAITVTLVGAVFCYGTWVWLRTRNVYTGFSIERVRYSHLSDDERLRMTCLSAHGRLDAAQGNPREFCRPFHKEDVLLR